MPISHEETVFDTYLDEETVVTEPPQHHQAEHHHVSATPAPLAPCSATSTVQVSQQTVNNTTPTPGTPRPAPVAAVGLLVGRRRAALAPTPVRCRPSPLPVFPWADSTEIWETMMSKEELPGYRRDRAWFSRHPELGIRLRTVLLDWLMEVEI